MYKILAVFILVLLVATACSKGEQNRGPRGGPGPSPLESTWTADRSVIVPGDTLTITAAVKNIFKGRQDFIPKTANIDDIDTRLSENIPVAITSDLSSLDRDTITFSTQLTSDMTSRLRPGRYTMSIRFHVPGVNTFGTNSGLIFVVVPQQGAMNKTVQINETVDLNDTQVTLKEIIFAPEETTIIAIASLPDTPIPTPTPGPTPSNGITPTPPPTATPIGQKCTSTSCYRIDGGEWKEMTGFAHSLYSDGIHLKWTLGPVAADARTFHFSLGALSGLVYNPGLYVTGPWEWTVPLN